MTPRPRRLLVIVSAFCVLAGVALVPLLAAPASASASAPASARADVPWAWPIEPHAVLRKFAVGPFPWSAGHRGVDLATSPDTPVRAPEAGVVTFSGVVAGRGVVVLSHLSGDALRSSFEPVRGTAPIGTRVTAGEVIAKVAPSAVRADHCSSGGCLHWGLRRGETYLDPLAFVQPRPIVLLPPVGDGRP